MQKVRALYALPVLQIRVDGQGGGQGGKQAEGPEMASDLIFQDQIGLQPSSTLHKQLLNSLQHANQRVCACFHTGGTTGAPKLALHTHGNEVHTSTLAPLFYGFDEHSVELNGFPLFHVAGAFVYGLALLSVRRRCCPR